MLLGSPFIVTYIVALNYYQEVFSFKFRHRNLSELLMRFKAVQLDKTSEIFRSSTIFGAQTPLPWRMG